MGHWLPPSRRRNLGSFGGRGNLGGLAIHRILKTAAQANGALDATGLGAFGQPFMTLTDAPECSI